jgi:hypothetical protein
MCIPPITPFKNDFHGNIGESAFHESAKEAVNNPPPPPPFFPESAAQAVNNPPPPPPPESAAQAVNNPSSPPPPPESAAQAVNNPSPPPPPPESAAQAVNNPPLLHESAAEAVNNPPSLKKGGDDGVMIDDFSQKFDLNQNGQIDKNEIENMGQYASKMTNENNAEVHIGVSRGADGELQGVITSGTIDSVNPVYPPGTPVFSGHTHPSGSLEASEADISTRLENGTNAIWNPNNGDTGYY